VCCRFHVPVAGRLVSSTSLSGGLQSVNADGMRSNNDAIYNQRQVLTFETDAANGGGGFGRVAVVPIGATCVGSIKVTPPVGALLQKGDELGMFQFGGSTVVVVFEAGRVVFDEDLLLHSTRGVESMVLMGQSIGQYTS
jgi:phosphatidylserine decarboxylase